MTDEQILEKIKEYIDNKYYTIMRELKAIHELLALNGNDAEAIAELQRRLNDERQASREMEMENFFQHKDIKPIE